MKYAPDWTGKYYIGHSIYFQVLGEHGFVGFALCFGLLACTLFSLRTIRRQARQLSDGAWFMSCAGMIQISLVAYLVAGAFYNLASFDLVYFLIGITIILRALVADELASPPTHEAPPSRAAMIGESLTAR